MVMLSKMAVVVAHTATSRSTQSPHYLAAFVCSMVMTRTMPAAVADDADAGEDKEKLYQ